MLDEKTSPVTPDDHTFWAAYRTNAGREIEDRLIRRISDEFLSSLIGKVKSKRLSGRLANEHARRAQQVTPRSFLAQIVRLFRRSG